MSKITFRPINTMDASAYLLLLKQLDKETNFLMFNTNERNDSIAQCQNDIKRILENHKSIVFVAVNALGELVGHVTGECAKVEKKRHVMRVSIGVLKTYYGIGRALLEKLIQYADDNGIVRLEAEIMVANTTSLNLSKKFGFLIEGKKACALKIHHQYFDEYMVARVRGVA